ncbi:MAG: ribonuclease HI family protein [Candidatus Berkelbacteria bacterium]|nr:ribonuclease HI family protein [Candidatus Berkelbacteria bacterium]
MIQKITVHTDGASRGNPGKAAIAFVIEGLPDGNVEYKEAIGIFSNNQAEYRAMLAVAEKLVELKIKESDISFFSDSELMIKQIKGEYRVKDVNLRPLFDQVLSHCGILKANGNKLQFHAIRRELNKDADRLANVALDKA